MKRGANVFGSDPPTIPPFVSRAHPPGRADANERGDIRVFGGPPAKTPLRPSPCRANRTHSSLGAAGARAPGTSRPSASTLWPRRRTTAQTQGVCNRKDEPQTCYCTTCAHAVASAPSFGSFHLPSPLFGGPLPIPWKPAPICQPGGEGQELICVNSLLSQQEPIFHPRSGCRLAESQREAKKTAIKAHFVPTRSPSLTSWLCPHLLRRPRTCRPKFLSLGNKVINDGAAIGGAGGRGSYFLSENNCERNESGSFIVTLNKVLDSQR